MAIITRAEVRQYLDQLGELSGTSQTVADAVLDAIIPRAESIVLGELGFTPAAYGAATQQAFYSDGTSALLLPPYQAGSLSAVRHGSTDATPLAVTSYYEDDGVLYLTGGAGPYPNGRSRWATGVYYLTASWGFGPATDSVKEVCLEVAVNIWRGKDRGMWTEVAVGSDVTALRFTGGLNKSQKDILRNVRLSHQDVGIA